MEFSTGYSTEYSTGIQLATEFSIGQRQGIPPGPSLQADKPATGAPGTAGHVPWTRGLARPWGVTTGRPP